MKGYLKLGKGEEPSLEVSSNSNHVYFYSQIDAESCLSLVKELKKVDAQLLTEKLQRNLDFDIPIYLHMQSEGGDIFSAFALADHLKLIRSPVYSIIEGLVASAATVVSMSCTKRFITRNSLMMIHQISAFMGGKYDDILDTNNMLRIIMEKMVEFYKSHSKLDEREVKELLKRDTWLDADKALELGFVDEIVG